MDWIVQTLDDDAIKRIEEESKYQRDYCAWCNFGESTEDDCFCEENCGELGCQGLNSSDLD